MINRTRYLAIDKKEINMSSHNFLHRIISLMVALALILSVLPASEAFAEDKSMSLNKAGYIAYPGWVYTITVRNATGKAIWSSSDSNVAVVSSTGDNSCVVVMCAPGTATITAQCGEQKLTSNVTCVDSSSKYPFLSLSEITLYPEETFKLFCLSAGKISWSSSNKKVAKVSSKGLVTAKKAGTATITAKFGGQSLKCTVHVVKNKKGNYLNPASDTDVFMSTGWTVTEYDRFNLVTGPDMYIPSDMPERIERAMNDLEAATGLKFYPEDEPVECDNDKIFVSFYRYSSTCASSEGPIFNYQDVPDMEYDVIVHELCHVLQARNSCDLGRALSEGYAEYYAAKIAPNESINSNDLDTLISDVIWGFEELTADNIESQLLNPPDIHPLSGLFVWYIVETYGEEKLVDLIHAINTAGEKKQGYKCCGNGVPFESEEEIYKIIKKNTSKSLSKNFYKWCSKLLTADYSHASSSILADASGTADINELPVIEPYYILDAHGKGDSRILIQTPGIAGTGDILIDFNPLLAYASRINGIKAKGISLRLYCSGTIDFYNADNEFIRTESVEYNTTIEFKDAVKAVLHIDCNYEYDPIVDIIQ